jgi:signal transduction histidine kinase
MDRVRDLLVARRDEILAAALLVFGLAELGEHELYQGRAAWPGPWPAGLAQAVLLTLPLAWRRRRPTASAIAIMGSVAAASLLWGAPESTAAFLAMLVTLFSATAYARRPALVVALCLAGLAVHNAADPSVAGVVDWFWSAGFAAVAVLLGTAVRSRQLRIVSLTHHTGRLAREYDERVAAATAAERATIARELHDVVAHAVSVIVIHAQAGSRAVDDDPQTTRQLLDTIETTGRSALADLRRLLRLLSSDEAPVDPSPGLAHLESLVAGFRLAGLGVTLRLPDPLPALSGAADLAAYRLVQEALTNTLRHAPGATATVVATVDDGCLELIVEDNGRGEPPTVSLGAGRGLIGMRERVTMAGGTLLESAATDDGFRVRARLPLGEPEPRLMDVAG